MSFELVHDAVPRTTGLASGMALGGTVSYRKLPHLPH